MFRRHQVDHLLGLKENVIIGKLITAGTGMEYYRNIEVEQTEPVPLGAEMGDRSSDR